VGSVDTGKSGDVKQIENAMKRILLKSHGGSHHPAQFEIQEIGIKVTECSTGKVYDTFIREVTLSIDVLRSMGFCLTVDDCRLLQLVADLL